ncbi:acyltransferase family protein [Bifidobacterium dentium]|uniref:acyltransferase family protein n=1 Tax=Bifidobacterium dentium TaxID=1689 RepID=UPI003D16B950
MADTKNVESENLLQHLPISTALSLISNLGGVGDCLFFFISIWYICEETANYKRQFKRVWILERELLFWSLLLLVCDFLAQGFGLREAYSRGSPLKHLILGVFPALSDHWWFPTNYMLFLLIVPVLSTGLRKAGEQLHGTLAIILLVLYGFIPFATVNSFIGEHQTMNYSVWLFIYQFVLITYIRWYRTEWLRSKSLMTRIMWIGGSSGIISQIICTALVSVVSGSGLWILWYRWMNCPACFPSMMFSLGLLALAQQKKPRYNKAINRIASATLTVYLLLTDSFVNSIISTAIQSIPQKGSPLFCSCIASCILLFAAFLLLGLIRQSLFSITIDRHRGHWFELLWSKVSRLLHNHLNSSLAG